MAYRKSSHELQAYILSQQGMVLRGRRVAPSDAGEGESDPATEVDAVGDPHDHILRIRNF